MLSCLEIGDLSDKWHFFEIMVALERGRTYTPLPRRRAVLRSGLAAGVSLLDATVYLDFRVWFFGAGSEKDRKIGLTWRRWIGR